jgi:uncharacterized protein YidB (DUF937 family)
MLDQVLGSVLQAARGAGAQQQQQSAILGGLLGMMNSPQVGGLAGLVRRFEQSGLGDLVGGWVAVGPNPNPTAQQVEQGLGADMVAGLAKQLGVSPGQLTAQLVTLLPLLIDTLTPDGRVPEQGGGGLLGALGGLLDGH